MDGHIERKAIMAHAWVKSNSIPWLKAQYSLSIRQFRLHVWVHFEPLIIDTTLLYPVSRLNKVSVR